MATFTKFNIFPVNLGLGKYIFNTHTHKIVLTNTLPVVGDLHLDDITQISGGGNTGYVVGGHEATFVSYDQTDVAGIAELVLADVIFTGGSDTMGAFKYAVLIDDSGGTDATKDLIAWYEYAGAAITLQENETFKVDYDDGTAGNGVLTITA